MIRRAINSDQSKRFIEAAVKEVDTNEVLTPVRTLNLKCTVTKTQKNASGMARGWQPTPEKPLTNFQALKL